MDENSIIAAATASRELKRLMKDVRQFDLIAQGIAGSSELQRSLALANDAVSTIPKSLLGLAAQGQLPDRFRIIERDNSIALAAKALATQDAAMKRALGSTSLEFMARRAEIFSPLDRYSKEMGTLMGAMRLPDLQLTMLARGQISQHLTHMSKPAGLATMRADLMAESLAAISKPWAVLGSEQASVAAALHLSQFSSFAHQLPAFSKERFALVTSEFGQFDRAFPIAETGDDDEGSEAVYTEAGRNESLVAFPNESYDDVLSATGWAFDIKQPNFIRADGTTLPEAFFDPHDHHLITMIEGHLREAICAALVAAGGLTAILRLFGKHVPNWERKRGDAVNRGEPELHVIYYADFMEMADVILNKELWLSTFKPIFRHRERLRMALVRLHGLRIQTAHSRPLTRTARLRLWAEAREIFEALGVAPKWQ